MFVKDLNGSYTYIDHDFSACMFRYSFTIQNDVPETTLLMTMNTLIMTSFHYIYYVSACRRFVNHMHTILGM